jgi:hypothetical protein
MRERSVIRLVEFALLPTAQSQLHDRLGRSGGETRARKRTCYLSQPLQFGSEVAQRFGSGSALRLWTCRLRCCFCFAALRGDGVVGACPRSIGTDAKELVCSNPSSSFSCWAAAIVMWRRSASLSLTAVRGMVGPGTGARYAVSPGFVSTVGRRAP